MTVRRTISKSLQEKIMADVDGAEVNAGLGQDQFWLKGEDGQRNDEDLPLWFEYIIRQKRPYSFCEIEAWNEEGLSTISGCGFSKCIGVHKGRQPDQWNAREGIRLAVARAASEIGLMVQEDPRFLGK